MADQVGNTKGQGVGLAGARACDDQQRTCVRRTFACAVFGRGALVGVQFGQRVGNISGVVARLHGGVGAKAREAVY